ncbi:ArsR/SmtB family transcription factor [Bacillus thuringiensis]|uniref:ArsR/SmtB family transcription factor n=1 Tax=Bacillus thuringiensis TaxID=1428 RepID=UPI0021D69A8B|nr:metalloregulator ArsR/SmtB family transcription factor [Bacillus thuringiensis]MCU7666786.1 metalloregulator ArsR/SmtB family transcription factor [Bacillus thuringiensis]
MIKSMAHPTRLEIATILVEGESNVSTLQEKLGIAQSTTSIHLGKLKNSGVLKARRKGLEMFYSVKNEDNVSAILSIISE